MNYYVINLRKTTVHLFGGRVVLAPAGTPGHTTRLLGFARTHEHIVKLEARGIVEVIDESEYRVRFAKGVKAPVVEAPVVEAPVVEAPVVDDVDTAELEPEDTSTPDILTATDFGKLKKENQRAYLETLGLEVEAGLSKTELETMYKEYLDGL